MTRRIGVGIFLGCLALQVVFAMRTKSPTCDEFSHHVASGYSYLLTRDFRLDPGSPPLPRMLAALPLLAIQAKAPLNHSSWTKGDAPEFSRQFFQVYNHSLGLFIFLARIPTLLLSIFFGLSVFLISRKLLGDTAGLVSLALYCFCPDILAHSGLATADLAISFFFFLALYFYSNYLKEPGIKNLALTGFMAGLAFLSKYTAILIFPILLISAFVAGKGKLIRPARTMLFIGICFFTVWAGYLFEIKPLLQHTPDPAKKEAMYEKVGGEPLLSFAKDTPVPLSTFSSAVVSMTFNRSRETRSFLMGEWSNNGKWYYYIVAFFIKNTIPFLVFCVASFFLIRKIALDRVTKSVFYTAIIFFFLITLKDKAQAGIRYFLPLYPLFFVLSGGAAAVLWQSKSALKRVILALLAWHAAEAVFIYPDHLAYFNELIGGPKNGYRYLRDSNIDWGQDLKGLGEYAAKKQYPEVVLYSISPADPAYYGIPFRRPEREEFDMPKKTVYAVGVHEIDSMKWTKDFKPDKIIGYSMFVYDFREKGKN